MSSEQLKVWAHLVTLDKHRSCETLPDKPFFRGKMSFAKPCGVTATTPDKLASKPGDLIEVPVHAAVKGVAFPP